jgi:hypothetical protein
MAAGTTSSSVQQLYADVVADLQAYYDDAVLLPNQAFIMNSYDISGSAGNTVRIPLTNSYTNGASVNEGESIIAQAASNLVPTAANITLSKFGVGTDVSEESLEDGGVGVVRQAVLTRLSRGLAQAVDINGFATLKAGITQETGDATGANAAFTEHFVCSPECLASASKRTPSVAVWYNPNLDAHEFRGTVRHGFAVMRPEFGVKVTDRTDSFTAPTANLDNYLQAVSTLRSQNAPELADGSYIGFVSPKEEFAIAKQLASVGDASIGSLSDIGNRALLNGLIGQAAGITFFRSNNLPDAS